MASIRIIFLKLPVSRIFRLTMLRMMMSMKRMVMVPRINQRIHIWIGVWVMYRVTRIISGKVNKTSGSGGGCRSCRYLGRACAISARFACLPFFNDFLLTILWVLSNPIKKIIKKIKYFIIICFCE